MPSPPARCRSSRSDRIMPSEVSRRSFERPILRPSRSAVPGSATATVSPAPKFQAPHTIWRGARSPTSTLRELQAVGVGVLARLEHVPGDDQLLDAVEVKKKKKKKKKSAAGGRRSGACRLSTCRRRSAPRRRRRGQAAALDALDLVARERELATSSSSGGSGRRGDRQPLQRHLHRTAPLNCSRKRTSLS